MAREKKAFPLRLDAELHRAVEKWAEDEFRSVNGHIEFLLREALRKAGRLPGKVRPVGSDTSENQEM
ncbi:Arc family DNA-binding protein [Cohnella soli]|uniref:Arc family DNA-binding protein n=1 Tax=Cohnella soli TaxID=425005 RepID=A0ABW0HKH2_9BACL